MAYILNFGKHEGKSIEWLFFNDPGYVEWIIKKEICNDSSKFSPSMKVRFTELVRRASNLIIPGLCPWCKKKPITRMFLTKHTSGGLARVDFDCEDCQPLGSSQTAYFKASFFSPDYFRNYDKFGAKELTKAIKFAYFGESSYRMTQKRMEDFFNNKSNFVDF
jgi:hypothetical protein